MITLHELLDDPEYRRYFLSIPDLPDIKRMHRPWRVMVQRDMDGPWAKKEFWDYRKAFHFLKPYLLEGVRDAAIQSKAHAFAPPSRIVRITKNGKPVMIGEGTKRYQKTKLIVWKPKLFPGDAPHTWCCYCRRPTEFRWFVTHHAFKDQVFNPTERRCTICGASESLVRSAS